MGAVEATEAATVVEAMVGVATAEAAAAEAEAAAEGGRVELVREEVATAAAAKVGVA